MCDTHARKQNKQNKRIIEKSSLLDMILSMTINLNLNQTRTIRISNINENNSMIIIIEEKNILVIITI